MKRLFIIWMLLMGAGVVYAQAPANDNCAQAININAKDFCSADGAYNNIGATPSSTTSGNDVWFKFTAIGFEVTITVTGNTLAGPKVSLMEACGNGGLVGSTLTDGNSTVYTKGGLTPGSVYYISVGGTNANTGTFKLCTKNYNPPAKPGQDYVSGSNLCSTNSFPVINLTGPGSSNNETAGTCLPVENNSVWYRFEAANNGTLVFTITPTKFDDIDWVLYDLGPATAPRSPSSASVLRCAAGHGISNQDCPSEPLYSRTGLDFNAQDFSEAGGCGQGQDGVVKYVDLVAGNLYAIVIDNFTQGANGFTIDFTDRAGKAGTAQFVGPTAPIQVNRINPCTPQQIYKFSTAPTNYTGLRWFFGEGASVSTSNDINPPEITYSTAGEKTAVLEVTSDKGCTVVNTITFIVGLKPDKPVISGLKPKYCIGETIELSTQEQPDAKYLWTGPNGFTSTNRQISVPVDGVARAGTYSVQVTRFDCVSDPTAVMVDPIGQNPVPSYTYSTANFCTPSQTFTFSNTSTDATRVRWNFGDGASVAPGGTNNSYTVSYSSYGIKTITLEAEGNTGCVNILTQQLNVNISPSTPVITSNKPDFCLLDTIELSTAAQPDVQYFWTGPNNFSSTDREVRILVENEAVSGTYNLTIRRGDCEISAAPVIIPPIYKNPVASFRSVPGSPSRLAIPITVRFFNESKDADSYIWDFGDGVTSNELNPEHTYTTPGDYDVSLTVFKNTVCSASVSHGKFFISANNILFVPNTFTPNNDGANDEFVVNMSNIKTYRIQIYNRYGVMLFTTADLFEHWNGLYKNEPVPVGTYYYTIDATDFDDKAIKQSGSVTILK